VSNFFPPRNQTPVLKKIQISLYTIGIESFTRRARVTCLLVALFVPLDFLLEEISRNHEVSRIKSIGGSAQVRFASVTRSHPRSSSRDAFSMPSSGGNQLRSPASPPLTRDYPCILSSHRTPFLYRIPLWHKTRFHILMR